MTAKLMAELLMPALISLSLAAILCFGMTVTGKIKHQSWMNIVYFSQLILMIVYLWRQR